MTYGDSKYRIIKETPTVSVVRDNNIHPLHIYKRGVAIKLCNRPPKNIFCLTNGYSYLMLW